MLTISGYAVGACAALGAGRQELNALAQPEVHYAIEELRSERKKHGQFDGQPEEDSEEAQ